MGVCDNLISRQAAIDTIENTDWYHLNAKGEMVSGANSDGHQAWYKADDIYKVLEELPSAQRWIPVSERLPEANGRYLATRGLNACGAMWNRVYLINYSDLMGLKSERIWWNGNVGKSDFERIDDVIAWMPIPKPYKEEDDGKIY